LEFAISPLDADWFWIMRQDEVTCVYT
jgi:hypothetical protein